MLVFLLLPWSPVSAVKSFYWPTQKLVLNEITNDWASYSISKAGRVKTSLWFRIQGFYKSTAFTNILDVCFTVVALSLSLSLSSHARSLTHGSYVVIATDRNQLSLEASTEHTFGTAREEVAASARTCALEGVWAPAFPTSQLTARAIDATTTKSDNKINPSVSNNHFRSLVYHILDLKFWQSRNCTEIHGVRT
jgi:hypothetical protein